MDENLERLVKIKMVLVCVVFMRIVKDKSNYKWEYHESVQSEPSPQI